MKQVRIILLLISIFIFAMAFTVNCFEYNLSPVGVLLTVSMSIILAVTCPFIKDK